MCASSSFLLLNSRRQYFIIINIYSICFRNIKDIIVDSAILLLENLSGPGIDLNFLNYSKMSKLPFHTVMTLVIS